MPSTGPARDADLAYLDRTGLTVKQCLACAKDLQGLPPMPSLADKIDLGERFIFLDCVQLVRRGNNAKEDKALAAIDWEPALRNSNPWYDRLAAAMRVKDRAKREEELDRIEEDRKALDKKTGRDAGSLMAGVLKALMSGEDPGKDVGKKLSDIMICLLFPAHRKVQNRSDWVEQVHRNLYLAFALAAYQRDHDRYPARLDDLAPKYLATVPGDLFSGKPLIYRPEANSYLLYSVGVNGKDDGGRSFGDDPPGDDLVVRMPIPPLKPAK